MQGINRTSLETDLSVKSLPEEIAFLRELDGRRNGIRVVFIDSPDAIKDESIKANILSDQRQEDYLRQRNPDASIPKRKHWIDAETASLYIYLPNIDSAQELEDIYFREIVSNYGLSGLLGVASYGKMCEHLCNTMPQESLIRYKEKLNISEDLDVRGRRLVGAAFCDRTARLMNSGDDRRFAKNRWNVIYGQILKRLGLEVSETASGWAGLSQCLTSSVVESMNKTDVHLQESEGRISDESFRQNMSKLQAAEAGGYRLDRGSYITIGFPSDILASSSPRMRSYVIELPMGGVYGYSHFDDYGRYVSSSDPLKKDKHPFSLLDIANLPRDLRQPLAVFASRHGSRPNTSVVVCQSRGPVIMSNEKDIITQPGDTGNFVVPITPKNVFFDRENGRRLSQSGGKRVNNIDSVYTKKDFEILRWLSRRRLVLYLHPDFERMWLRPVLDKYDAFFMEHIEEVRRLERAFEEEVQKNKPAAIQQFNSAEDGDRWSLLKLYREFKSLVESTTKVVKEFKNPKIVSQNKILYSISNDKDLPAGERAVVEDLAKFLERTGVRTFVVSDDDPNLKRSEKEQRRVLGYTDGVSIFLSAKGAGVGTFFHEYAHVWAEAMKLAHKNEWDTIKTILRSSPEWSRLERDSAYASVHNQEDDFASEVLAAIIEKKADKAYRLSAEEAGFDEGYSAEAGDALRRLFFNLGLDARSRNGLKTIGDLSARVFSDFTQSRIRFVKREGLVASVTQSSFDTNYKTVLLRTNRGEVPVSGVLPGVMPGDKIVVQGPVMKENTGAYCLYADSVISFEPQSRSYSQDRVNERGTLLRVSYPKSPGSDWCLATVRRADGSVFKMAGFNEGLEEGMQISCSGRWENYNDSLQFRSDNAFYSPGEDYKKGVVRYLTEFPGIGERTAERLVNQYGLAILDIIETRPELIFDDKGMGLSPTKQTQLEEFIAKEKELAPSRHAVLWLMQFGVTAGVAQEIERGFAPNTVRSISENPYRLTSLNRFGFLRADEIATKMGIETNSPQRIASAIHYVLSRAERSDGCSCMCKNTLIQTVLKDCLNDDTAMQVSVENVLNSMIYSEKPSLAQRNGNVYHVYMDAAEQAIVDNVNRLQKANGGNQKQVMAFLEQADDFISAEQEKAGILFSPEQREAIKAPLENNIVVITGGPGTGKTSAMKATIGALRAAGYKEEDIALCASTGKAAKRLSEQTGMSASTIHRLLKYNPEDGSFFFNEHNPVQQEAIIVDESSMIDTRLMASLLDAAKTGAKVVFIGDSNQLPPVGAGCPLTDMLVSGTVPYVQLRHIYRQGKDSDIIRVAEEVRDGVMPSLAEYEGAGLVESVKNGKDLSYVRIPEGENDEVAKRIHETIVRLLTEILPEAGFDHDMIQVLSPTKRNEDEASTVSLNKSLREIFNPEGESFSITSSREFRIGDKVILTKNMASEDVFNGDQGTVIGFNREEKTIRVDFQGNKVDFDVESSLALLHAYSITVHKSQGSEYPCVVIPVHKGMSFLLSWKLLYTAVTRGKSKVVIVGPESAVKEAVRNMNEVYRKTGLARRLMQECETVIEPLVLNARVASESMAIESERALVQEPHPFSEQSDSIEPFDANQAFETAISALGPREKDLMLYLQSCIKKAGINLHYVPDGPAYKALASMSESVTLRFTGSILSRENRAVLAQGVVNKNILDTNINVLNIDDRYITIPSDGKERNALLSSVTKGMAGTWTVHVGKPEQFFYKVKDAVLSSFIKGDAQFEKGLVISPELKMAVVNALPEIVAAAIDAEIIDAKEAGLEHGILCHRLFGAVEYRGSVYRVEFLCSEGKKSFTVDNISISGVEHSKTIAVIDEEERLVSTTNSYIAGRNFFEGIHDLSSKQCLLLSKAEKMPERIDEAFVNEPSASRSRLYGREYGWVHENDMFITRDGLNPYTTVRNYALMWAKSMQIGNPLLWARIVATVKSTPQWMDVVMEPGNEGAHYNEDFLVAETLSRYTADKGVTVIEKIVEDRGVLLNGSETNKLQKAMSEFWNWTSKDILQETDSESIDGLCSRVVFDLMSGSMLGIDYNLSLLKEDAIIRDLRTCFIGIPEGEYEFECPVIFGPYKEFKGESLPGDGDCLVKIDRISVEGGEQRNLFFLHLTYEDNSGVYHEKKCSLKEVVSDFSTEKGFEFIKSRLLDIKDNIARKQSAESVMKQRQKLIEKDRKALSKVISEKKTASNRGKTTAPKR